MGISQSNVVDLNTSPFSNHTVEELVKRNKEIYKNVQEALKKSAEKYKIDADKSRRLQKFDVGDLVMVHLRKDKYPSGTYSKLKAKNVGPFEILRKVNDNAILLTYHLSAMCLQRLTWLTCGSTIDLHTRALQVRCALRISLGLRTCTCARACSTMIRMPY